MHIIRSVESKVFTEQVLTGRNNKIITFKYCSEITFQKSKAGSWFPKMYSRGEQFIANHLLHWFSLLFRLITVLQQTEFYSFVLMSYLANA